MRSALLLLLSVVPAAAAQRQLTAWELGVGGIAALAARDFFGAAAAVSRRPGGQARLGVSVAGGVLEDRAALRLEATAQLVVTPASRGGISPYAGLGVAWQGADGVPGAVYFMALLGVEAAPGRRFGWYAEAGVGGGARLAVGVRWRRFPGWW